MFFLNDLGKRRALREAINFSGHTSGKTHNFYNYPGKFSPEFARSVITEFSSINEWVLDPFMGGGTSIIEGLTLGRLMIGSDINELSYFVATAQTTPLSKVDEDEILGWATHAASVLSQPTLEWIEPINIPNLPPSVENFINGALILADDLPFPRQRAFARCALLRLGQWALECNNLSKPGRRFLAQRLPIQVQAMLRGLREFVAHCALANVRKNEITTRRYLMSRNVKGLEEDPVLWFLKGRIKLVVTSPPYPGVHVLYHRWQYRGRKETPAPYWIANVSDGCGESFYTFGNRKSPKLLNYFDNLKSAFSSIRPLLAKDAHVVQLVSFSHADSQLKKYLSAMNEVGYIECQLGKRGAYRLRRKVPNRRWYAKVGKDADSASEVLLIHKPSY